jgi:hypothetical protein
VVCLQNVSSSTLSNLYSAQTLEALDREDNHIPPSLPLGGVPFQTETDSFALAPDQDPGGPNYLYGNIAQDHLVGCNEAP